MSKTWSLAEGEWTLFAAGVEKLEHIWNDEFVGSAEALEAAGLARRDQLPGAPGMRITRTRISADGVVFAGALTANPGQKFKGAGSRYVDKLGRSRYRVTTTVDEEIGNARHAKWLEKNGPFGQFRCTQEPTPRPSHLRLVWSAPAQSALAH